MTAHWDTFNVNRVAITVEELGRVLLGIGEDATNRWLKIASDPFRPRSLYVGSRHLFLFDDVAEICGGRAALTWWFGKGATPAPELSIVAAAKAMTLGPQTMYRLINAGLVTRHGHGTRGTRVRRQDLIDLFPKATDSDRVRKIPSDLF